jgi:hypothetical protein
MPRRERVDGLLLISLSLRKVDTECFLKANVPTVLVEVHHPLLDYVVVDSVIGAAQRPSISSNLAIIL